MDGDDTGTILVSKQHRWVSVILYGCLSAVLGPISWPLGIWYARSTKLIEFCIAGLSLLLLGLFKCPLQDHPDGGKIMECNQLVPKRSVGGGGRRRPRLPQLRRLNEWSHHAAESNTLSWDGAQQVYPLARGWG
jgi:hypothetical protein